MLVFTGRIPSWYSTTVKAQKVYILHYKFNENLTWWRESHIRCATYLCVQWLNNAIKKWRHKVRIEKSHSTMDDKLQWVINILLYGQIKVHKLTCLFFGDFLWGFLVQDLSRPEALPFLSPNSVKALKEWALNNYLFPLHQLQIRTFGRINVTHDEGTVLTSRLHANPSFLALTGDEMLLMILNLDCNWCDSVRW